MTELCELQRRLESIRGLREIINAMRNLAAVYVRRAEATLTAMRPYADVVTTALGFVLDRAQAQRTEPPEDAPALAVVFSSDQGLAGTFNQHVVERSVSFRANTPGRVDVVAIGLRGRNLLALRGVEPVLSTRAPTSLEGIRSRVPELATEIYRVFEERGAERMFFIYSKYESMGHAEQRVRRIVPPVRQELAPGEERAFTYEPILTAPPAKLLGRLVEEYFFVELYRSLLESHASENGARLAAMTAAAGNVDELLEELQRDFQSVRQDSITAELMDVVNGAEAQRTDRLR